MIFFFFLAGTCSRTSKKIIASNNRSEGYNFSTFLYMEKQESGVIEVFLKEAFP